MQTTSYPLSLHDALPIFQAEALSGWKLLLVASADGMLWFAALVTALTAHAANVMRRTGRDSWSWGPFRAAWYPRRSEEHTSELQSRRDLVCRLLLEKKKK